MPRGDEGSDNQEGAISFDTLRDEGQHFVHVQQFDKAIESFTKVTSQIYRVGDAKVSSQHPSQRWTLAVITEQRF